jgi:hypothetical protein
MANPNLNSADDRRDVPSSHSPTNRVASLLTDDSAAAEPQRVIYSCRVTIAGNEAEARIAAVKVRAFLRRYLKPKGLTIRLSEEYERKERRASA